MLADVGTDIFAVGQRFTLSRPGEFESNLSGVSIFKMTCSVLDVSASTVWMSKESGKKGTRNKEIGKKRK